MLKTVLLAESDPSLAGAIAFNLRTDGFMVRMAADVDEVRDTLAHASVHVAVVNAAFMHERYLTTDELRGIYVAETVLPKELPRVLYVLDDRVDVYVQCHERGRARWVVQYGAGLGRDLLDKVVRSFADDVKLNFGLRVDWSRGKRPVDGDACCERLAFGLPAGAPTPVVDDIEEVLGRLFLNADIVEVSHLQNPNASQQRRSSVLLRAAARRARQSNVPVVVKLSSRVDIEREVQGYERVRSRLGGLRLARMDAAGYSRAIGGISYSFLAADNLEAIGSFSDVCLNRKPDRVVAMLRRFFQTAFGPPYKDAELRAIDLYAYYASALNCEPGALIGAGRALRPDAITARMLSFDGVDRPLPNPLRWLLPGPMKSYRSYVRKVRVGLCHGDLHSANMLVDDRDDVWLIDFANVDDAGHIVRDFAELETDIKFNLLGTVDPVAQYALEMQLLNPRSMGWSTATHKTPLGRVEQRALRVLRGLRQTAVDLAGLRPDDMREYYVALLMHAVNVLRLSDRRIPRAKKEHALMSAAVLCDALQKMPRAR